MTVIESLLNILADVVTRARAAVLVVTLVVTVVLAAFIPRLQADFTPSDLFAKFEDQERIAAEFRADFGNTDNVLLVLVHADDVLAVPVLQHLHDVTARLQSEPYVARVDGLTTLPIPRSPNASDRQEVESGFLAALYTISAMTVERVGDAAGMVRGHEPRHRLEPAIPDALVALALGASTVRAAVESDVVTEEEAELLRTAVSGSRLLEGRLVSRDRTLTTLAVSLSDDLTRNADIERVVDEVQALLLDMPPPSGTEVMLGGLPFLRSDVISKMRADQSVMLPLSLVVCILVLFAAFRWLPAMLLPTAAVVVSAVILVGGMALVGEPFNIINNIVPLLIIIIGISNAIHLVNRYGEEIRAGRMRLDACRESVKRMAVACFLTSLTTAIGFASLVVSRTDVLQRFGVTAAIGVLIAYVATITFLPAALTFAKPPPTRSGAASEGLIEALIERVTRTVLRFPVPILGVSFVLLIVVVEQVSHIRVDSAVLDQFDEGSDVYRTTRLIEEKLGGVRPLEVYFTSGREGRFDDPAVLNAIDDIAAWARRQEGVIATLSYADFLHAVEAFRGGDPVAPFNSAARVETSAALLSANPRSPVAPYVTEDRRRARLSIGVRDFGAQATIALADALEAEVDRRFAQIDGVEARLTGDAYIGSKGLDAVITDLLGSLALAVFIIFGFMTMLFRSARLAALSVPPNVLPLVVTMAFMVNRNIPLNAATAIIFSISIGLAVDGTIHVLARFREEIARCADIDEALVAAARGTGKAILMTCLALMFGFGVMFFSSFVPVRRFGELIAMTIFGCLMSTIVILPALLKVGWLTDRDLAAVESGSDTEEEQ